MTIIGRIWGIFPLKSIFCIIHLLFQKEKKKNKFKIIFYQLKRENQKDLTLILHWFWNHTNSGPHCFENSSMAKFQDISYYIYYCFLPITGPILCVVKNNLTLLVFCFASSFQAEAKNNFLWAFFPNLLFVFPFFLDFSFFCFFGLVIFIWASVLFCFVCFLLYFFFSFFFLET